MFDLAVIYLQETLATLTTNEPINRAEGHIEQADLEKREIDSIRKAVKVLNAVGEAVSAAE